MNPISAATRQRLAEQWLSGDLLIPKHDPMNLGVAWGSYRSVLSYEMAGALTGFISSGNYAVDQYRNNNPAHSPDYFTVKPLDARFHVPASGVPPLSVYPSGDCDLLVVVRDRSGNWHTFGESSAVVDYRVRTGSLTRLGELM